jgi:hypothetical protein
MIDTEVMAEGWEDDIDLPEEAEDDIFTEIYVETATSLIYEVHMFDTFCLVRPASPNMYAGVRKLSHLAFSKEFHEFLGDPEEVRNYLRSANIDFVVE